MFEHVYSRWHCWRCKRISRWTMCMGICFSCTEWLYPISILSKFQPFLWFTCIFWCQTGYRLDFSLYFCAGLPSPCYKVVKVRRALSRWQTRLPTPCWVWRSHEMAKQYKAGIGWEKVVRTYWRRLLGAVFETLWNLPHFWIMSWT